MSKHPWRHKATGDIHAEAMRATRSSAMHFSPLFPEGVERARWRPLRVRAVYRGNLLENEHQPVVQLWLSRQRPIEVEPVQFHVFDADGGEAELDADVLIPADGPLAADTTIYTEVFSSLLTEDGAEHIIHTGFAGALLAEVIAAGAEGVERELICVGLLDEDVGVPADRHKGTVRFFVRDARVSFAPPGFADLTATNRSAHESLMASEVRALAAPLQRNVHEAHGVRFPHVKGELANVRVDQVVTGPMTTHGWAYFAMGNRTRPSWAALAYYFRASVASHGLSETAFVETIGAVLGGDTEIDQYHWHTVLDAVAEGLTLLANSLFYVADLAAYHDRETGRVVSGVIERFDDALMRGNGDCEDFAHIILEINMAVREEYAGTDPVLRAAQAVLRRYMAAATLMSVIGAQIADADNKGTDTPRLDDKRFDRGIGAHMAVVMLPLTFVAHQLATTYPEMDWQAALRMPPELADVDDRDVLPTLFLEGTGSMRAIQLPFEEAYGDARGRTLLNRRHEAVSRIIAPKVTAAVESGRASAQDVNVPAVWHDWVVRRTNEAHGVSDRATVVADFYRYYAVLFFSSKTPLFFDIDGGRVTLHHCTPCSSHDAHGRDAAECGSSVNRLAGAAVYDLMHANELTFLMHPGPSDAGAAVTERWARHMPPTGYIVLPDPQAEFVQGAREAFHTLVGIFKAAGTKVVAEQPLDLPADGGIEVWRGRSRIDVLDEERVREFARFLADNWYIAWINLELLVLREGVAVVELRIGVDVNK
ncbi:MAG TPA: hypothetical protein VKD22_05470 [Ramlibacter sp.]|nr:hypothetical protein [Ramlibacter sp.]